MIILDIETQDIIPPDRRLDGLRISVAGIMLQEEVRFFSEDDLAQLFQALDDAELIIGHNLLHFDYKVLQRYASFDVLARYKSKTFDIFSVLLQKTDRSVGLNDLAMRNLGLQKAGSGVDAPRLFKEGKIGDLQAYLAQDLRITGAVFRHIQQHGRLKYGHVTYKEAVEREIEIKAPHLGRQSSSA